MLFTIHKFTDDDTTHKYTSWKLASDKNMANVEDQSIKSATNLLAWQSNKIIPTGDVWYISSYRHIYDSEGNELAREWSRPKPVFNEVSNITDALAPKYYIKDPFITDISYNTSDGLSFKIMPYEGNIGYDKTLLELRDSSNNLLLTRFIDISNTGDYIISPNEVEYSNYNYIKISITHMGLHNVTSKIFTTGYKIKDIYYKIVGNKINLDPKTKNELTVESTNVVPVSIISATVNNMNDEFLTNCTIVDDKIYIPTVLEYNSSYKIALSLLYTDENNTQKVSNDVVYISTTLVSEVINFDPNFKYDFKISEVKRYSNDDSNFHIDLNESFTSEELFTHNIPLKDDRGYNSSFLYDNEYNTIVLGRSNLFSENFNAIQLITEKYGLLQYIANDKLTFRRFEYDSYSNTYNLLDTHTVNGYSVQPSLIKNVYINNELYLVYVDNDNRDTIVVDSMDITTGNIVNILKYKTEYELKDVGVLNFNDEMVYIHVIGSDVRVSYIFDINDKTITDHLPIPNSFVDKECLLVNLKNGGGLAVLSNGSEGEFEYYYLAVNSTTLVTAKLSYEIDGKVRNLIPLKNGKILLLVKGSDEVSVIEFK